ncbi:MAG TPA: hypothetical protein VJ868_10285 [Actinomycetota bacterium]|nr:hypothetical protein [Actinomycetota bacterium]
MIRRPLTVAILVALPMALLGTLLLFPRLDVPWEHHPSHFWLVLGVALVSVVLGLATSAAARQRSDARVFLVSMAFLSSAAFLGLHALATPEILLAAPNTGFVIATPIGLLLGSGFAAASALPLEEAGLRWVRRWHVVLRLGLAAVVVAWAVGSLTGLPFLERPFPEEAPGGLRVIALVGVPGTRGDPPAGHRGRVRPPGRGHGHGGLQPELADLLVGVARADGGGLPGRLAGGPP